VAVEGQQQVGVAVKAAGQDDALIGDEGDGERRLLAAPGTLWTVGSLINRGHGPLLEVRRMQQAMELRADLW